MAHNASESSLMNADGGAEVVAVSDAFPDTEAVEDDEDDGVVGSVERKADKSEDRASHCLEERVDDACACQTEDREDKITALQSLKVLVDFDLIWAEHTCVPEGCFWISDCLLSDHNEDEQVSQRFDQVVDCNDSCLECVHASSYVYFEFNSINNIV